LHNFSGFILAGFDPVAVDAVGSQLLGHNPKRIEYLTLANRLRRILPAKKTADLHFGELSVYDFGVEAGRRVAGEFRISNKE